MKEIETEGVGGRPKSDKYMLQELRARLKELAVIRVRYGYAWLMVLLRREGWLMNQNRAGIVDREKEEQAFTRGVC